MQSTKNRSETMLTNSLPVNQLNFKALEQKIYQNALKYAREQLKQILENLDEEIMKKRDKTKYRNKCKKKTSIKTIMGTVEYSRRLYKCVDDDGKKRYIYLLDQHLGAKNIGLMTENLVEKIVDNAINVSYRKTAQNITNLTGQAISHTAAWNVVQELGQRIQDKEEQLIKAYERGKLKGNKEIPILFEEADGIYLNMQGKDRKGGRKKELKLGITYEGWQKRYPDKCDEYVVINKNVVAGFHSSDEFQELFEATISQKYDTEKIKIRVLNGDGASWIKELSETAVKHYQLDRFHIYQAIYRNVYDKKEAKRIAKIVKARKIQKALSYIEKLKYDCGGEVKEVKKLEKLQSYLQSNLDGLISYRLREGIQLPEPPEGVFYKDLGTMEHNVCDVIYIRMKGRKMSWSIKGATNLSKILALKASGRLYKVIRDMLSSNLSERLTQSFKEVIKKPAQICKETKTNIYPIAKGGMPFSGSSITNGRKAIRDLIEYGGQSIY